MLAKKTLTVGAEGVRRRESSRGEFRKELDYLYARRTTVDTLIQSLQNYDRFRATTATPPFNRKSA